MFKEILYSITYYMTVIAVLWVGLFIIFWPFALFDNLSDALFIFVFMLNIVVVLSVVEVIVTRADNS